MIDYDIWYDSPVFGRKIIGNLQERSDSRALKLARQLFDGDDLITVSPTVKA